MKKNFIQMRRLLLTTIAGLLGISTASCAKYGTLEAEYGCPEADFDLSGYVTDRGGNPIEGIEVKHTYRTDTTVFAMWMVKNTALIATPQRK